MKIDLTGKNILVTGASRGIGKAIAGQLAAAGARIAVHYNTKKEEALQLAKKAGNKSEVFSANLENKNECRKLFRDVVQSFGKLDVLINNAGIAFSSALDKEDTLWEKEWDTSMAINLDAPGILCREAIRHFIPNGGGRIITIASRASFRGDTPDYLAYAASKAGLVGLSRSIARGYGKQGIKSFLIAPGFVRTDMAQDFMDQYGEGFALNDIALQKLTEPGDIAPIIVLLSSGLADHATGCTIDINAGSYVH